MEKPFETLATVGITGTDPFRDWDTYLPLDTCLVNTDTLLPGRSDIRRQERVNSGVRLFPDPSEEAHDRAIEDIYQEFLRQRHSRSANGGAEPPDDPREGETFRACAGTPPPILREEAPPNSKMPGGFSLMSKLIRPKPFFGKDY